MLIEAPTLPGNARPAATPVRTLSHQTSRAKMTEDPTGLTPPALAKPQPVGPRPTDEDAMSDSSPAGEAALAKSFKLLADETRLRVLMALLRDGESHVSALCERLDQSQPAVSHHLALLRDAEIVEVRREGKHNFYNVRRPHFERVMGGLFDSMLPQPATVVS